jgi:hypothetical protein
MATIVYLDVEDEITSAATRIRNAPESRVGLVLPFGSRLATSRINFRLLAREAMVNGRRLDLIAPDPSARALAASAGLPVFGSVAEYEEALESPAADAEPAKADDAATDGASAAGTSAMLSTPSRAAGRGPAPTPVPVPTPDGPETPSMRDEPGGRRGGPRVIHARRLPRIRPAAIVGFGMLLVALLVAGVAAYVFLPSAEITVTPRIEPIGPISLTVRADPAASGVDAENGVIPAISLAVPVESSGEFPATGKRVAETKATGGVRWTNCDPTASYTIPKGTLVKTASGIAFATDESVFLPVATLSGSPPNVNVSCQTSEVSITASKSGTDGNVAAGAIKVIPAKYNRTVMSVSNLKPTSGGTHDEFLLISQADVDAAIEQVRKDIDSQFATALENGAGAPEGTTVFPDTATLGEPVTDVDPATLVGKEVDSFTLGMTATGHVLAVDASPVEAIAEARLRSSITSGYELVPNSTQVTVGDGSVVGGVVQFPVEGSAKQVRPVDAAALKQQVLGLSRADAMDLLRSYGTVKIALWPDWASGVPSLEQRVTLTVATPVDETPAPTPVPTADPSSVPDASGAAASGEPVPSG